MEIIYVQYDTYHKTGLGIGASAIVYIHITSVTLLPILPRGTRNTLLDVHLLIDVHYALLVFSTVFGLNTPLCVNLSVFEFEFESSIYRYAWSIVVDVTEASKFQSNKIASYI